MTKIWDFFSTVPHCVYFGAPLLAFFHLVPNVLIFVAYVIIAFTIDWVRRRRKLRFDGLAALFSSFILLCGIGHLLDAFAIDTASKTWHWLADVIHTMNSLVSLAAAVVLIRHAPELFVWPTIEQYEFKKEMLEVYRSMLKERVREKKKGAT